MSRAAAGENVESAIRKRVAETLALVEKGRTKTCDERFVSSPTAHAQRAAVSRSFANIDFRRRPNVASAMDEHMKIAMWTHKLFHESLHACSDVGTTLRHLGLNPRQDQLQKILEEVCTS